MFKILITFLFFVPLLTQAEIRESRHFDDLLAEADADSLVLIDIDDTLLDSAYAVGTSQWRQFIRPHLKGKVDPVLRVDLYALFTYVLAKKVPARPVEAGAIDVVRALLEKNVSVLCCTARGKKLWHFTPINDIEQLTLGQLKTAGYDFSRSKTFEKHPAYADGVLFTADQPKGEFLKQLFSTERFIPKKVIFIDDQKMQVESVEQAMQELGIPSLCIWYRYIEQVRESVDLGKANLQFEKLLLENSLLRDEEVHPPAHANPDLQLKEILSRLRAI